MSIEITRIDERLIHGQVAYSWSVAYQINSIIVIDDTVATDETQKMLLSMAVPSGKSHKVLTVKEAVDYLKSEPKEKLFIVVKSPEPLLELVRAGVKIDSINVGGMYFKKGKKEISKTVYLDQNDIEVFKELQKLGVACEIRTAPNDKSIDLFTKV